MLFKKGLIVNHQTVKISKLKKKPYEGKIKFHFHGDRIPKEGSHHICLSIILIDSVFKMNKNYYPQMFLKECKYIVKEKQMTR